MTASREVVVVGVAGSEGYQSDVKLAAGTNIERIFLCCKGSH